MLFLLLQTFAWMLLVGLIGAMLGCLARRMFAPAEAKAATSSANATVPAAVTVATRGPVVEASKAPAPVPAPQPVSPLVATPPGAAPETALGSTPVAAPYPAVKVSVPPSSPYEYPVTTVGIPRGATMAQVKDLVLEHGKTRMPVYEDMIDNVVGYVTIRDLMALLVEQQLLVLEDAIRPAFKVRETKRAVDLLAEMRERRTQLAIVVDEGGAMTGLVTLEDLVEELVGEIADEHDDLKPNPIQKQGDGTWIVRGDTPIRDVNREIDVALPESENWTTLAGLCLELSGRIPAVGAKLKTDDGVEMEIVAASPSQVKSVRVRPLRRPNDDDDVTDKAGT